MKISLILACAVVPLLFTACATPQVRQVYHSTDNSALVIKSLDTEHCEMVQPAVSALEQNNRVLDKARALPQRQTAVVILENYTEPQPGEQFRDRGTSWFVGLRGLGYEHIFFLQGNGGASIEGLPLLVRYD